jgi:hypothetical protein
MLSNRANEMFLVDWEKGRVKRPGERNLGRIKIILPS